MKRHKASIQIHNAAFHRARGPKTENVVKQTAAAANANSNYYNYGTKTANAKDTVAENTLIKCYETGQTATVTSQQASHIRQAAEEVKNNRENRPPGVQAQLEKICCADVRTADGKKVVDGRMFGNNRKK